MPATDDALLADLQRHVDALWRHELTSGADQRLNPMWTAAAAKGLAALVTADGRVNADALRNFRRDSILTRDLPTAYIRGDSVRSLLAGWQRGARHCLLQCLEILRRDGCEDLLRKYPCVSVGNPHTFRYQGYCYTFRWARHVYFLGLLRRVLGQRLGDTPTVLDIGSSYGIFSSLVRQEYPGSRHILVDLPEQLLLAHYFLGSSLPAARIAGPAEVLEAPAVTRDFLQAYDFVLIPTTLFDRLAPEGVDLVTNFGSFGEMSRQYFDGYWRSPALLSARYVLMANRVAALPELFDNDMSILDYPVWDSTKRLHFDVCPMYSVDFMFQDWGVFWYSVTTPPPHFEYAGRI